MKGTYKRTSITESRRITSRLLKRGRTQQFHVRVQFLGMLHFVCPWCGKINHRRLHQKRYWVKCSGCNGGFVPKLTLLALPPGGPRNIPPDFIIPDAPGDSTLVDGFPHGDMGYWRNGTCTHDVVVLDWEQVTSEVKKQVLRAVQGMEEGSGSDGNGGSDE